MIDSWDLAFSNTPILQNSSTPKPPDMFTDKAIELWPRGPEFSMTRSTWLLCTGKGGSLMKRLFKFVTFAVSASFLFFFCTPTKITNTWKDDGYRGAPFSDLFVIGVAKEENTRRAFENKFVEKLQAAGVQAVASSSVMPSDQKIEKEAILAAIEKLEIDAVLITRLVSLTEEEIRSPSTSEYGRRDDYHGRYYGDYSTAYGYTRQPAHYTTSVRVGLETKLYDVGTEKLVWAAASKTANPKSKIKLFDSVIEALVRDLKKNKLLP
jgi:hypothetical protein